MRILILDDDMQRHEAFERHFHGSDLRHAFTFAQACEAFSHFDPFERFP